ncbi:MAG: phosphoglucomutase/phosphomannomutase family protein [Cyclonatronaceae bacterium]
MTIKFGTAGWRGIIARDFTFDNLNLVMQAIASWITEDNITDNGVILGYDTRFMGREFAEHAACVLAAMGIPVRISRSVCSTPAISWAALEHDSVGVIITGSHNPPIYNGVKIKAPFGGPVSAYQSDDVEARISDTDPDFKPGPLDEFLRNGLIRQIDLNGQYLTVLRRRIDTKRIRRSNIMIAHDSMYGAGQGLLRELLGSQILEIHSIFNPGYHGRAPEPKEENLRELADFVVEHRCSIGLATDGDAERVGLFDEKGQYVDAHLILSLLTKYFARNKGLKGCVIKTFSTTHMLNRQAEKYGLILETTPVGFKYISEKMLTCNVIIGGEESGGMTVKGHIPDMDGIYISLLIIEMILESGKPLSILVRELFDEFGPNYNRRVDIELSEEHQKAVLSYIRQNQLKEISGLAVVERETKDGTKLWLEDGTWILVRSSGTEPLLRIYCESDTAEKARLFVDAVSELVTDKKVFQPS